MMMLIYVFIQNLKHHFSSLMELVMQSVITNPLFDYLVGFRFVIYMVRILSSHVRCLYPFMSSHDVSSYYRADEPTHKKYVLILK